MQAHPLQTPLGGPAGSRTAGPFLKYINCLPGTRTWRGSVLFLTHDDSGWAQGNGNLPANDTAFQPAAPSLTVGTPPPKGTGAPAPAAPQGEPLQPTLLDTVLGWSFWRWELALELEMQQRKVEYTVTPPLELGSTTHITAAFWLPAVGQPFHWAYTSCNGISSGE